MLCGALIAALTVGAGAGPAAADDAPDALIDDFAIDVAPLRRDCPTDITPVSSSVAGPDILGSELDLEVVAGPCIDPTAYVQASVVGGGLLVETGGTLTGSLAATWDGVDNSATVDATGLGGIDLTAGGTKDSFDVEITDAGATTLIGIRVYTDAANFSTIAGPISAGSGTAPFAGFLVSGGTGADFTNVGAISLLTGGGSGTSLTVGSLSTTSVSRATMTDALVGDVDSDGQADPGDTIEYTVAIANPADMVLATADNVTFTLTPAPNGDLVTGSVSSTQGAVTTGNAAGDASVAVDLGALMDGTTATVTFRVVVNAFGDLANQGAVTYSVIGAQLTTTTTTETDDPDTVAFSDDTITAVPEPLPSVSITDAADVDENAGTPATFTVSLSSPFPQSVSVRAVAADGTAAVGSDFVALDEIVSFAPGQTTQEVTVDVIDDGDDEADETFVVQLLDPTNATIGTATAQAMIIDDDPPPPTTTVAPTTTPTDTTPAVPTTIAPPTTTPLAPTVPGTLPATGSDTSPLAIWALLTVGLGAALVITVRRRHA